MGQSLLENEVLTIDRYKQASLIVKLFDLWALSNAEMLNLLGLSPRSVSKLHGLKTGTSALSDGQDAQDRVGYLLDIHKALGLLFPENPQMKYSWVKTQNRMIDGKTPLQLMLEGRMLGIIQVNSLVNSLLGR
ncbi:MbcA/ParS/Xre antitoxin family protein [Reinekea forsetii]|nr:MbcA/ParS/Xre antitoxin family protein [Reinekea forsetii]MDO7645206.1 MbcA/ParS/Xre antitoxin family protein [Reinekea forsetii]